MRFEFTLCKGKNLEEILQKFAEGEKATKLRITYNSNWHKRYSAKDSSNETIVEIATSITDINYTTHVIVRPIMPLYQAPMKKPHTKPLLLKTETGFETTEEIIKGEYYWEYPSEPPGYDFATNLMVWLKGNYISTGLPDWGGAAGTIAQGLTWWKICENQEWYNEIGAPLPPLATLASGKPISRSKRDSDGELKVFLAYDDADKEKVQKLYLQLQKDGTYPWMDSENLEGGENKELHTQKAFDESDVIVICLSQPNITQQSRVNRQIGQALKKLSEMPENAISLIPLKLEECDNPDKLNSLVSIDYYREGGHEFLLRSLRKPAEFRGLSL